MADRPINLYQHEVKAVRAGRQTQLRRVLKPQPRPLDGRPGYWNASGCVGGRICVSDRSLLDLHKSPMAGDRLWVRETWKPHSIYAGMKPRDIPKTNVFYLADDRYAPSNTPWIAAPQMPRWASRITLLVDEVRVQRLQEISEEDAVAQGVRQDADGAGTFIGREGPGRWVTPWPTAVEAFSDVWNSIQGPGAWEANPWVEVRTFRTVLANIDQVPS